MLDNEERSLMKALRQRGFLENTMREDKDKVEGKRARGRQRLTFMGGLTSFVVGDLRVKNDPRHASQDWKRFRLCSPTLESNKALPEEVLQNKGL